MVVHRLDQVVAMSCPSCRQIGGISAGWASRSGTENGLRNLLSWTFSKMGIIHDSSFPLLSVPSPVFDSLRKTSKLPGRVRGVDMRNLLLLLPFLLHNLLEEEVEDYNRENPFDPIVDPSSECIGIVLLLIDWYLLFRRRFPPKDEVDIKDLQVLGMRY